MKLFWCAAACLVGVVLPAFAGNIGKDIVIKIEHVENTRIEVRLENASDLESSVHSNLSAIEEDGFLDFPAVGAFQFRNKHRQSVANSAQSDWFYPAVLNSVIQQPIFTDRGSGERPQPPPLLPTKLAARETKSVYFDYGAALQMIKTKPELGDAVEFRIKIDLTVEEGNRRVVCPVVSDWMKLP